MTLPDPQDRHVLAAAIEGGADVIVTCNLTDFPANEVSKHGLFVQHPDELVTLLLDSAPELVLGAPPAAAGGPHPSALHGGTAPRYFSEAGADGVGRQVAAAGGRDLTLSELGAGTDCPRMH